MAASLKTRRYSPRGKLNPGYLDPMSKLNALRGRRGTLSANARRLTKGRPAMGKGAPATGAAAGQLRSMFQVEQEIGARNNAITEAYGQLKAQSEQWRRRGK